MRRLLIVALFGVLAIRGLGQEMNPAVPVAPQTTDVLTVQISPDLSTNEFHAPATVFLQAIVTTPNHPVNGHELRVNFFANTNYLGWAACVWHDARRPVPLPGDETPLPILPAGYSPGELVWTNAPVGVFLLTATVVAGDGESAVSAPDKITVHP
jgi:hypothetical protein